MKKLLILIVSIFFVVSCGDSSKSTYLEKYDLDEFKKISFSKFGFKVVDYSTGSQINSISEFKSFLEKKIDRCNGVFECQWDVQLSKVDNEVYYDIEVYYDTNIQFRLKVDSLIYLTKKISTVSLGVMNEQGSSNEIDVVKQQQILKTLREQKDEKFFEQFENYERFKSEFYSLQHIANKNQGVFLKNEKVHKELTKYKKLKLTTPSNSEIIKVPKFCGLNLDGEITNKDLIPLYLFLNDAEGGGRNTGTYLNFAFKRISKNKFLIDYLHRKPGEAIIEYLETKQLSNLQPLAIVTFGDSYDYYENDNGYLVSLKTLVDSPNVFNNLISYQKIERVKNGFELINEGASESYGLFVNSVSEKDLDNLVLGEPKIFNRDIKKEFEFLEYFNLEIPFDLENELIKINKKEAAILCENKIRMDLESKTKIIKMFSKVSNYVYFATFYDMEFGADFDATITVDENCEIIDAKVERSVY